MDLNYLFNPKTIAVIGANDSESFGGAVCKNLSAYMDVKNRVYYVNPKRDTLFGEKCYDCISNVPVDIDLLIIATNKHTVIDLLKEGKNKAVKAAIVFASGFSETGIKEDIELEEKFVETAKELDIAILGPNCAGFSNFANGINTLAFLSEKRDRKGNIGIISQSGMIALSLNDNQYTKFSYNISCGNSTLVNMSDLIYYLADDKDTKTIGLYIDGIKDIEGFEKAIAHAHEKKKRVTLIKSGSNEITKLLVKNHTGSVEKFDDAYFNSMLKKYDVIRCKDLEEFIYTLITISYYDKLPKGKNVASINLSGGEAALVGEVAADFKLNFPEFSEKVTGYLKEKLPSYASISNPLDMTVTLSYDSEKFADALEIIMNEESIDLVLIGYTLLYQIDDPCIYYMINAIKLVRDRLKDKMKPIFLLAFMSNTRNQEAIEELMKLGVVCLPTPHYGLKVIENICG